MATNTTNFNLKKPAYTDTADIADINGNMDKVDVSLNGLADAIAIVANNNTHAAITAGQYVYVHGHGSLAEGLYTAKSNIAANATLSTSNLQADGSGGLNALNSKINPVNGYYDGTVQYLGGTQPTPLIILPPHYISDYNISVGTVNINGVTSISSGCTVTKYNKNSIYIGNTGIADRTSWLNHAVTVELTFTKI